MRIVGFETDGGLRLGVVDGDAVIDLQAVDPRRPLAQLRFGLPVPRPGKILCLGLNYLEHAKECGHARPQFPSVFLRCLTSLVSHQSAILRPSVSETLDYEAELLVVIGRRAKHVTAADALA